MSKPPAASASKPPAATAGKPAGSSKPPAAAAASSAPAATASAPRAPNKPIQETLSTLPLRTVPRKKKPPRTAKEALIEKVRARAGTPSARPKSRVEPRVAPGTEDAELDEAVAGRDEAEAEDEAAERASSAPPPPPSVWQRIKGWLRRK